QGGVSPSSIGRRQLEDIAPTMSTATVGGAVEVARRVESQSIHGAFIGGAVEGVQHRKRATRGRQLESCAAIVSAPLGSGAVEIPLLIKDEVALRLCSVTWGLEAVENIVCPAVGVGRHLEGHSRTIGAAAVRRTVKVPGLVEDHAAKRTPAAGSAREGIKEVKCPLAVGTGEFVNRWRSAAIDVARLIEDQVPNLRVESVTASREAVKHGFRPGTERGPAGGGRRFQIENRAAALTKNAVAASPEDGRSVETAVWPEDDPAGRRLSVISSREGIQQVKNPRSE